MQSNLLLIPLHLKWKKIQGLFKDLHRNSRTFQGKMAFKDFSRTHPEIQGLSSISHEKPNTLFSLTSSVMTLLEELISQGSKMSMLSLNLFKPRYMELQVSLLMNTSFTTGPKEQMSLSKNFFIDL